MKNYGAMMKVYYVNPDCPETPSFDEDTDEVVISFAEKHREYVTIYNSLHYFEDAFNNGDISDEGYIFFIGK